MLKHYTMHLKNVIIFKCVISFLCILIISWLLQLLNADYIKSVNEHNDTEESLAEETLKLYSIISSQHKILETFAKYSQLLSISSRQNCQERSKIASQIIELTSKYDLNEPITVNMKQELSNDINSTTTIENNTIKIKNYSVEVKLATKKLDDFMEIIREIYSLMPKNTIILSVMIRREEILVPSLIYKLSTDRPPDLVYIKLNMRIREITAKNTNSVG